jgi:hypothetical protein
MIDLLLITMLDGRRYTVAPEIVATDRANYYQNFDDITFKEAYDEGMAEMEELSDWLLNNLDFEDIEQFCEEFDVEPRGNGMEACTHIRSNRDEETSGFCK